MRANATSTTVPGDAPNLSAIDVNLVVALHALLEERSVTRAARRVGLGQSSMSHALARLRAHFDDPLLVPAGRTLVLTERARALVGPVVLAVAQLQRVFAPAERFTPATSARAFHLAAPDNLELYLLPRLLPVLAREAPGVTLRVHHLSEDWLELLRTGAIDLKLGRRYPIPDAFHAQDLLTERITCVLRQGHPMLGRTERLTLAKLADLGHVIVSPREKASNPLDEALAARGLRRRVVVTVAHFLVAPFIVAGSDLALMASERLVAPFLAPLGLRAVPLPLRLTHYTLSQVWAARSDADEGHRWLRETIARVLRG